MATLFLRWVASAVQAVMETLVFPSTNHLANGGCHSNTSDHFFEPEQFRSATRPKLLRLVRGFWYKSGTPPFLSRARRFCEFGVGRIDVLDRA